MKVLVPGVMGRKNTVELSTAIQNRINSINFGEGKLEVLQSSVETLTTTVADLLALLVEGKQVKLSQIRKIFHMDKDELQLVATDDEPVKRPRNKRRRP
jgi:hypothetical protein